MITGDFARLLLALVEIIAVAQVLGLVCRRFGQPAVIGEITGGILLGPTLFHGGLTRALFPADIRPGLTTAANVGVCVFMFLVGLHLNDSNLRGQGRIALTVSLGSTAVPFGLGVLLAVGIVGERPGHSAVLFCLFVGTAMSVTAFPVLARILTDRGLIDTPIGDLSLGAAAIGDALAWSSLAMLVAFSHGSGMPWRVLLVLPFVALLLGVVRPVLTRFAVGRPAARDRGTGVAVGLGVATVAVLGGALWLSAQATAWMGLHLIFGSFLLGTALPRSGAAALRERVLPWVERINRIVLLPAFFVVAGLAVNLSTLGAGAPGLFALMLLVAVGGKWAGAFGAARLGRVPTRHSAVLAVLLNTRGLTELIVLSVGLQIGLLDQRLYSLMVLMALVTTAMAGPLLSVIYPPWRVARDRAPRERALDQPLVGEESTS
ncbi:MAG TPA: cation:proton antiporter [Streptosporangiaceae bacterium]|nr:cation:proton antiporter [Streptosporangiaceae bacterium]